MEFIYCHLYNVNTERSICKAQFRAIPLRGDLIWDQNTSRRFRVVEIEHYTGGDVIIHVKQERE
jgi:hypothetical protein